MIKADYDTVFDISMKAQERHDRPVKVHNGHGLGFLTTESVGLLLLGEAFRGSLGVEVGTNAVDGRSGGGLGREGRLVPPVFYPICFQAYSQ